MIDLVDVRKRPEAYQVACDNKRIKLNISEFLELDSCYRKALTEAETLRAEKNSVSKEIPQLKGEEKEAKIKAMQGLSSRQKELETELAALSEEWKNKQLLIPGIPLEGVPVGESDADNVEMRTWGDLPKFDFVPKSHIELGSALDILDIERGVKIAGSRSYFLKGDGTRLQHAVLNFTMDHLHKKGYTLFEPPHIVRYEAMMGTGYFPGGEDQAYRLDDRDPDMFLIGTSEVSVCAYHYDEILEQADLPKRYAGYSPCYRREAGTYGKDTQGVYRIHQFYKVEQVVVCEASEEESRKFHAELLSNAEEVLQALNLPYRVVSVCTGDMGQGQVYKNDIETWMPSRSSYGETHSCSSFNDFQARRLNIRYRSENGKNVYCYTLNNTCIASPRVLIPILEMYQQADGSVVIPEVLRPYMGGQDRIGG